MIMKTVKFLSSVCYWNKVKQADICDNVGIYFKMHGGLEISNALMTEDGNTCVQNANF